MATPRTASCSWEERKSHFEASNNRQEPMNFNNLSYLMVDDADTVDDENDIPSDTSDPMLICMARGL